MHFGFFQDLVCQAFWVTAERLGFYFELIDSLRMQAKAKIQTLFHFFIIHSSYVVWSHGFGIAIAKNVFLHSGMDGYEVFRIALFTSGAGVSGDCDYGNWYVVCDILIENCQEKILELHEEKF